MAPEPFVEEYEEGLVGKIKVGRGVGIRMWREEGENSVIGYVVDFSDDKIILSTNHPLNEVKGFAHAVLTRHQRAIYYLKDFTHYAKQKDE